MVANTITISRTVLTFGVLAGLGRHFWLDIALIFAIAFIIALDALDGYIARKRNATSETGAVLDTLADRMIENTFWIYFSVSGLLPVWVPIVVMCRGFLTDALQGMHGVPQTGWRFALTRTRVSRFVSGVSKLLAFVSLASTSVFENVRLENVSLVLALFAVGVCLLRGVPFFLPPKPEVSVFDVDEKLLIARTQAEGPEAFSPRVEKYHNASTPPPLPGLSLVYE